VPVHDDTKSQLNARYLEGLASIENENKNEARALQWAYVFSV